MGWLLGIRDLDAIEHFHVQLSASWAESSARFWIALACIGLLLVSFFYYNKYEYRGSFLVRNILAICRATVLILLFISLANPVLHLKTLYRVEPILCLLIDASQSMAIEDQDILSESKNLPISVVGKGGSKEQRVGNIRISRTKALQNFLENEAEGIFDRIQQTKQYRLEAFLFSSHQDVALLHLDSSELSEGEFRLGDISKQIHSDGQVTNLGAALEQLNSQVDADKLAGVLIFSDFANNSGVSPLNGSQSNQPSIASRLGVPIYTVGLGDTKTVDLALEVNPPIRIKRGEKSTVRVNLQQHGFQKAEIKVKLLSRPLGDVKNIPIQTDNHFQETKTIKIENPQEEIAFSFTPEKSGWYEFVAEVETQDKEVLSENNRSRRNAIVVDDYFRLTYITHKPNWEWRFIKEVFHRDKLVGEKGFRTFLSSADPEVRMSNSMFLHSFNQEAGEFFENDVFILGEMSSEAFSSTFCQNLKRFVSEFGGGLIILVGPSFGLQEMAKSELVDLLPVEIAPDEKIRDVEEFDLQLTTQGLLTEFMRLGDDARQDNEKVWENINPLTWYQPVKKIHPLATVLAEHPRDICNDGKTKQPLIALRRYGRGEVVYIAFDETWRLRKKNGGPHYRRFWSQLISRLALNHELGTKKRFAINIDKQQYHPNEQVHISVDAYDQKYQKLDLENTEMSSLEAEIYKLPEDSENRSKNDLVLTHVRSGRFEASFSPHEFGEYRIQVQDPVTKQMSETRFQVVQPTAEYSSVVRNEKLQLDLASTAGGHSYELSTISRLINDLPQKTMVESAHQIRSLWATPLWFILIVTLMIVEWSLRKVIGLS